LRIGVAPTRVQVRGMARKWASCSSKGLVTLSSDLLSEDSEFVDYVIVHELLHLQVPNHGRLFRALLTAYTRAGSGSPKAAPSAGNSARGRGRCSPGRTSQATEPGWLCIGHEASIRASSGLQSGEPDVARNLLRRYSPKRRPSCRRGCVPGPVGASSNRVEPAYPASAARTFAERAAPEPYAPVRSQHLQGAPRTSSRMRQPSSNFPNAFHRRDKGPPPRA
jgi:hypothetical protein